MIASQIALNDGNEVPDMAFGSATRRSDGAAKKSTVHLLSALKQGFRHLDTAQRQQGHIPKNIIGLTLGRVWERGRSWSRYQAVGAPAQTDIHNN